MPVRLSVEHQGTTSELPPPIQIIFLGFGGMIQTALVLAAEAGVADHLADGPRSTEELARSTSSHARSLYRVLRLLSSFGIFSEVEPGRFREVDPRGGVGSPLVAASRGAAIPTHRTWSSS